MKKILTLFVFILFAHLAVVAQSVYSTQSTPVLQKMKSDAAAAGDYGKAADIKKELDGRTAEQQLIVDTQAQLDASLKTEDYASAARLKDELARLKANRAQKEQLRTDIAASLAAEDYAKAADLKNQLNALNGVAPAAASAPPPPPAPVAPAPAPTPQPSYQPAPVASGPKSKQELSEMTPAERKSYKISEKKRIADEARDAQTDQAKKNPSVGIAQFSIDPYAPFGLSGGKMKQHGVAFYCSYRFSYRAFKSTSGTSISNGAIQDNIWYWEYTGNSYYSRFEANGGLIFKLFGDVTKVAGGMATAIGIGQVRYMYDYNQYSPTTGALIGTQTLLDNDFSSYNFLLEESFILSVKHFNMSLGLQIYLPNVGETSPFVGFGFNF